MMMFFLLFFFFQAEDGIRDKLVTGVQTCALPILGWLGEREGTWLHERARGIDRAPVETNREAKSVSRDETFATDLDDDAALAARLLSLADRASADVRESGLVARTVTVKLRDADFTTRH